MVTRTIVTHHAQVTPLHPAFAITASALRTLFTVWHGRGKTAQPCYSCTPAPTVYHSARHGAGIFSLSHNHPLILPASFSLQPPTSSQQAALAVQPTSLSAPTPGLPPIGSTQACPMNPRYCFPLSFSSLCLPAPFFVSLSFSFFLSLPLPHPPLISSSASLSR
jgi:hypothetical protein